MAAPDVVYAGPDDPMGGGMCEIVLARSSNHHTLSEGSALCPTTLTNYLKTFVVGMIFGNLRQ